MLSYVLICYHMLSLLSLLFIHQLYASYVRMIKQQVLQGDIENICIRLAPARMWTWLANSKTATEHIVHLETFSPFQSISVSAPSERKGSMSFSVATVPCKQLLPGKTSTSFAGVTKRKPKCRSSVILGGSLCLCISLHLSACTYHPL